MRRVAVIVLAVMIGGVAPGQEGPREIRIMNGKEVDLTPVLNWVRTPEYKRTSKERPMPHWKAVRIQKIRKQIAGWDVCEVKNEAGDTVEVLIANLPKHIREPLAAEFAIQTRLATLRGAAANNEGSNRSGPNTTAFLNRQMGGIQQEMGTLETRLANISGQASAARAAYVLVMLSGKSYAQYPIWDYGKAKTTAQSAL